MMVHDWSTMNELTTEQMQQITLAIAAGRNIEAIKLYREFSGAGLKDSKDFIDSLAIELHEKDPDKYPALPTGKGCLGVLGIVALSVVSWLLLEHFRINLTRFWRPFRPLRFFISDTGLKPCALCGRAFSP